MSEQMKKHRAEMARLGIPAIEEFVQAHPAYTIDPDQAGSQGVTNYVIFGHRGTQPVVFKYFCRDERKEREIFALRHFAATGLVPQLLAETGTRLIVITRWPGGEDDSMLDPTLVGRTLGQATAKLLRVPLSTKSARAFESRFYDGESLHKYLDDILRAAWSIHRQVACYGDAVFAQSLATIEASLPYILSQPRLLYHQDALNMHFAASCFVGFFDLEMCRIGTEAMQIGSLWHIFVTQGNWAAFAQGYADITGRTLGAVDLEAGRAFAHFLVWRYISHYGDWHGEPLDEAKQAAEQAKAERYRHSILRNNTVSAGL